jgi:Tfp pilus assembly protein PilN
VAKKKVSININLVPKDPFFNTYLGKILKWALSVGRYIVIFTEILVIVSFVTRFSLDRQVTDLNGSIHQKETIIESFGDLESNVRMAQAKIDQYLQIEQKITLFDVFPALSEITPRGVELDQLVIKPDSVLLRGTSTSQKALNTLITNIQLSPVFFDVEVGKIETSKEAAGFEFSMTAKTKTTQ